MIKTVCLIMVSVWYWLSLFIGYSGAADNLIRVGYQPNVNHADIIVADKKGYFVEEGLVIDKKAFIAGAPLREGMIAGTLDITQMGSTPAITTASVRAPIKAIMTHAGGGAQHSLIVRNDSEIKDPCQTKGQRVGVFVGSMAHYGIMLALKKQCGFSYEDYKFVMMNPPDAIVQLEAKLVDAIILWEDFGSVAVEDKKIGKRLIDARDVTLAPGITLVTESFANKYPNLVIKYIRACAKAMRSLVTNFDESLDILTKEWNRPKDITRAAMERFFYDPRITKEIIDSWKEEAEFLFAEKKIKAIPNWNTFIETRYLNEAIKGMTFNPPYVPGSVYFKK